MMARTRADVDALNELARAAQAPRDGSVGGEPPRGTGLQAGTSSEPAAQRARIAVGDGHVRNGDRLPGPRRQRPRRWLIVEDLKNGRGRPCCRRRTSRRTPEYGWEVHHRRPPGRHHRHRILLIRAGRTGNTSTSG